MKKNIYIVSIYLVISAVLLIISYFTLFEQLITIKLNGPKILKIEVNEKYKELGAKVYGTNKSYTITGHVDTSKLTSYTLTYKIKTLTSKSVKRHVIIVDTTKPNLTLIGGDISINLYEEYKEPGFTAIDNYDGNITDKVIIKNNVNQYKAGEYEIQYIVEDSSNNKTIITRKVTVKDNNDLTTNVTYINNILLVNKKYALPKSYNPGINYTAYEALKKLQQAAKLVGYDIPLISGFRSYSQQQTIYNNYVKMDGQVKADTYSARPGHSEHQTGLAFDVGEINDNYGSTPAGIWLAKNAHLYGFIIRYPKNKIHITGYKYEPWHIRYIGIEHATNIYNRNITLEEYLEI